MTTAGKEEDMAHTVAHILRGTFLQTIKVCKSAEKAQDRYSKVKEKGWGIEM